MNLQDQLREALRREDPPEGFADRVILRAKARREQVQSPRPRVRFLWPAAAFAAAVALVLSISIEYRAGQQEKFQQEQAREEQAGQQAIQALRLVSEELNIARSQVLKTEF